MARRAASAKKPEALALLLSPEELSTICRALDSHIYWELSDTHYRDSGYVADPGADDEETAEEIAVVRVLLERLEVIVPGEQR